MKYKDYKFWFIRRDDNGFITEAGIRFYEGEYKNVKEKDLKSGTIKIVNRYVRTKRLNKNDLTELKVRFIKEATNNDAVSYTSNDFGKIKTDNELQLFLNKQLVKVKGQESIAEQKCQH